MSNRRFFAAIAVSLAITPLFAAPGFSAENAKDLIREALVQQSGAQRAGCTGVQRTLAAGADATLVVKTAVEMGFNSCQVIRCSLEGKPEPEREILCDQVIRGAVLAGVQSDVISRCSAEYCDPAAVAAILGDAFLELNYCYFAVQPLTAPDALPLQQTVIDRSPPASQASPYTF